jgi:hypothetical protein
MLIEAVSVSCRTDEPQNLGLPCERNTGDRSIEGDCSTTIARVDLGALMAIRALSHEQFTRFGSAKDALAALTAKAVEWFTDDRNTVFGAIAHHARDLNWTCVVLARDDRAQFNVVYLEFGFRTSANAREVLVSKMEAASGVDEPVLVPART